MLSRHYLKRVLPPMVVVVLGLSSVSALRLVRLAKMARMPALPVLRQPGRRTCSPPLWLPGMARPPRG